MRVHRFYYPHTFEKGSVAITDAELVHQITKVLKLKKGEVIELLNGVGTCARAVLKDISKKSITIEVEKVFQETDIDRTVALYCAILKKEHFEEVVQKATEIGASRIIPLKTARTIKTGLNFDRLQKIIIEATEQSGRAILPVLSETMALESALMDATMYDRIIFCDPSGKVFSAKKTDSIAVFIGPEGGWTEEEIKMAREKDAEIISFGTPVLRGETAALIGTYIATL